MQRIEWLALGVILCILGTLFIIVGFQHSSLAYCTTNGVPNCFGNPNYSPLAFPGEIAGMVMTAIGLTLSIVVVLGNLEKKASPRPVQPPS
jgi:hypothetical protein